MCYARLDVQHTIYSEGYIPEPYPEIFAIQLFSPFLSLFVQVQIRSICHSRVVTDDYLKFGERFNMKQAPGSARAR